MNDADVDDLARVLAEHEPKIGSVYFPSTGPRGHIVGCSCMDAREYLAAGFRPGWDGWREHFAAVASGVVVSARDVEQLADDDGWQRIVDVVLAAALPHLTAQRLVVDEDGRSPYMDGTFVYGIRIAGRPGLVASQRMRPADADRLRALLDPTRSNR